MHIEQSVLNHRRLMITIFQNTGSDLQLTIEQVKQENVGNTRM
jgi:hypothetical protein